MSGPPAAWPRRPSARSTRCGYRKVMDDHGVDRVRIAATSAARDAANRDEFFDAVEDVVEPDPSCCRATRRSAWRSSAPPAELDPARGTFLVVDIGGGSTEFIVGTTEVDGVMSIDVGCVRLTEKYIEHDPPLPEELTACISLTDAYLEDVMRELPDVHRGPHAGRPGRDRLDRGRRRDRAGDL